MRLVTLASGSKGNSALVSIPEGHLLIDAGISTRRIRLALQKFGLTPEDLTGILITHEHKDHIQGLRTLIKRHTVPIYAPALVAEGLCREIPEAAPALRGLQVEQTCPLGAFFVTPFPTPHDTAQSVGYRIEAESGSLGFATDTGCVTDAMFRGLAGAETVVIEANHDLELLRQSSYPRFLQERIRSPLGHLSNAMCAELAVKLTDAGARHIVLAHLSQENNTPGLARRTVSDALERRGCSSSLLEVAPADSALQLEWTKESAQCSVFG